VLKRHGWLEGKNREVEKVHQGFRREMVGVLREAGQKLREEGGRIMMMLRRR
jgi:hypothetical protein